MWTSAVCYDLDAYAKAISSPNTAPKIAPDQGLLVNIQVLPEQLPKYPIAPPMAAPIITPIAILIIIVFDLFCSISNLCCIALTTLIS